MVAWILKTCEWALYEKFLFYADALDERLGWMKVGFIFFSLFVDVTEN